VTFSLPLPFETTRPNVTRLRVKKAPRGSPILNEALGIHAADGVLLDMCFNTGSMWNGLAYHPLRCDIEASLPNLDIIADWRDLPNFTGAARITTAVADPLFVSHLGASSAYRRYASAANMFGDVDILAQVASILTAARRMLHPVNGTLILKVGDQVHDSSRQWQWFKILKLAEEQDWLLCDEWVQPGTNMPDVKRLHRYHFDSQVRWLVLHTGSRCPGPGLVLPGRARCAHCGRVVACKRVRQETYCRRPRTCRQDAYRERRSS